MASLMRTANCGICWIYLMLMLISAMTTLTNPLKHPTDMVNINTCLYGNLTYSAGSRFKPDSCTYCHCPKHGGRPRCVIEDCKIETNCVRYMSSDPNKCCQICMETGCQGPDGKVYILGEVVSRTPCKVCVCPEDGGRIECTAALCPTTTCVDRIKDKDDCCYRCPNGPNCWLGSRILPAGELVEIDNCRTCHCPVSAIFSSLYGDDPRAVCSMNRCI